MFSIFRTVKSLVATVARFERMFTLASIKLGEHQKALDLHAKSIDRLNGLAPVNLEKEIIKLTEQVAALKATHQRFAGRFDKYVSQEREPDTEEAVDDPKWIALRRAQEAGSFNGAPGK